MHRLLLLLAAWFALVLPGSAVSAAAEPEVLTVILVRHGEKAVVPPENKDPDLSAAGQARAQELARMLGGSGLSAVFASQLKRTQQTVQPLCERLKLTAAIVRAQDSPELVRQLKTRLGQTVLVAGHNNTVPEIILALGGPKLEVIPESEYDNLFVLTVFADGRAKLVRMKYGAPTSP